MLHVAPGHCFPVMKAYLLSGINYVLRSGRALSREYSPKNDVGCLVPRQS